MSSRRLIDLETLEFPVRLCERAGIRSHVRGAITRTLRLINVVFVRSSQRSAQINVGNDTLISEVRRNAAVCGWEVGCSFTPGGWVRTAVGDVGRN